MEKKNYYYLLPSEVTIKNIPEVYANISDIILKNNEIVIDFQDLNETDTSFIQVLLFLHKNKINMSFQNSDNIALKNFLELYKLDFLVSGIK